MNLGIQELLIIGGIVLLLFGGKKIPELMRSLGGGVKEFKTAMREDPKPTPEAAAPVAKAEQVTSTDKK